MLADDEQVLRATVWTQQKLSGKAMLQHDKLKIWKSCLMHVTENDLMPLKAVQICCHLSSKGSSIGEVSVPGFWHSP